MKKLDIDKIIIEKWKKAINEEFDKMLIEKESISWFKINFSNKFQEYLSSNKSQKIEDYIRDYLKNRQMNDLNLIQELFLNQSFEIVTCRSSIGSKFELNSTDGNIGHIIQESDCFTNSLVVTMKLHNDPELIYGIAENEFGIPAIHMWNFIESNYYDYTWEIQKHGVGKRYFIIKRLKPYEYFWKWRKGKYEQNNKKEFHSLIMKNINMDEAKIYFENYRKNFII